MADNRLGGYWKLAKTIKDLVSTDERKPGTAVVRDVDADGTVWVAQTGTDEAVPVTGTNIASAEVGDVVTVDADSGKISITGNATDPAVGASHVEAKVSVVRKAIDRVAYVLGEATAAAQEVADEAKNVAEAINQHFWTDGSGIHVTQEEKEDFATNGGPNILVNSSGVLLRNALTWLSQFTPGSVAFYDGNGNTASHLMASFGPTGVRQYVAGVLRSLLDASGLTVYDESGNDVASFGSTSRVGKADEGHIVQTDSATQYWYSYDGSTPVKVVEIGTKQDDMGTILFNGSKCELAGLDGNLLATASDLNANGSSVILQADTTNANKQSVVQVNSGLTTNIILESIQGNHDVYLILDPDSNIIEAAGKLSLTTPLAADSGGTGSTGYGSVVTNDINTAVSVASSAYKSLGYVQLTKGTWLVEYTAQFASDATGRRIAFESGDADDYTASDLRAGGVSANAVSGGGTYLHGSRIVALTSDDIRYLNVWQNSGSALSCYGFIRAFRLK